MQYSANGVNGLGFKGNWDGTKHGAVPKPAIPTSSYMQLRLDKDS